MINYSSDLNNALWQAMEKEHLDPENKISESQWSKFLGMYSSIYADQASELAQDLFDEYKDNYLNLKGSV
jgi:hypothetical protein